MADIKNFFRSKVTRNASWLICGNILNKIVAFIVSVWTARYLGPGDYGLITYATAFTTFFFSIVTLGINSVIVKKLIDAPDDEGTTMGTALVLQGISAILSVAVIWGIVSIMDGDSRLTVTVVLLYSFGLFFQVFDTIKFWFQSKLKSKYSAIATLAAYIITSAYKVLLLVTGKSVVWFAFANSVDYICMAVILFTVYRARQGPRFHFSFAKAKDLLLSSYPYILSGLMVAIYGATDKLMLKQMLGELEVGYYGTALSVSNIWVFVLAAIIESFTPVILQLFNTDREAYRKKNVQLYAIVFYLSVFVSLGITVFADFGINLLYGAAYDGAVAPLRIVTWYVAFSYLGVARDVWVVSNNCQRHTFKIYFSAALVNVAFNILLIPVLGASGAALASLITQISTIFIVPLFIRDMRPTVGMMVQAILLKKIK